MVPNCCAELRQLSTQLVREPIFIDVGPAAFIQIRVKPSRAWQNSMLTFSAVNLLTPETAFGILHLLHHLRHASFRTIRCSWALHLLNQRLLDLLPTDTHPRPMARGDGWLPVSTAGPSSCGTYPQ